MGVHMPCVIWFSIELPLPLPVSAQFAPEQVSVVCEHMLDVVVAKSFDAFDLLFSTMKIE